MADSERGIINYSGLINKAGEQLLQCLKDPTLGVIACMGWNGIGRWRIAEYAANIIKESRLFDIFVWVEVPTNEWGPRKVQMKIAECLGIQQLLTMYGDEGNDDDDEVDKSINIATQINAKLRGKKFLLVLGDAFNAVGQIDLAMIGVPNVRRKSALSKVVLIGNGSGMQYDRELRFEVDNKSGISSATDVWHLFCEETALAAHSLRTRGFFIFTPEIVMDCLMYISLFKESDDRNNIFSEAIEIEWLTRYFIAEGFLEGETQVVPLMEELQFRSFLRRVVNDNVESIQMHSHIMEVAKDISQAMISDFPPKDDEHGWGTVQRMSILLPWYDHPRLAPSPNCPNLSTLFLKSSGTGFQSTFFEHMPLLRVLDLRDIIDTSLPSSVSFLCNLRLLRLRACNQLELLPTSLRALEKLEFLDLSNCSSLEMLPNELFERMSSLVFLNLSYTKIKSLPSSVSNLNNLRELLLASCESLTEIPDNSFENMQHLQGIDLSYATALNSLPSSLSKLVNLKKLDLDSCSSLKTGLRPHSLQNLSSLEVLDLSNCRSLEDIRVASFQHILPKLKHLEISYTQTPKQLSFRGCQSIESLNLNGLENLQVLDLSGTKLKTLYLDFRQNVSLYRLDILPMRYADRDNFIDEVFQFKELNWGVDDVGACIWVSDLSFFISTASFSNMLFTAKCFSRFYIRISPYEEEQGMPMAMGKLQNIHLQRRQFVYKDIYLFHTQAHRSPYVASDCVRRMEICGGNHSPRGIDKFLALTQLVTLFNNSFVERLSDLCNVAELANLKECRFGSCQRIKSIFSGGNMDLDMLKSLEVIWASDLPQLTTVCDGVYGGKSFSLLKYIFLERCSKLVTLFTSGVHLQSLETLEIRFCSRLEDVFGEEAVERKGSLPSLRSLSLIQVPKLKSICSTYLPQLQHVKVHRCRKLRKLPIRVRLADDGIGFASSLPVVEIKGELEWWKNLEWVKYDSITHLAHFRPWRHSPAML